LCPFRQCRAKDNGYASSTALSARSLDTSALSLHVKP
jgi:hypothetical protein